MLKVDIFQQKTEKLPGEREKVIFPSEEAAPGTLLEIHQTLLSACNQVIHQCFCLDPGEEPLQVRSSPQPLLQSGMDQNQEGSAAALLLSERCAALRSGPDPQSSWKGASPAQ